MMMIYRKYFYLIKKFLDCEERTYCSRRASTLYIKSSIEFEETGVVIDETTASETIVSVI